MNAGEIVIGTRMDSKQLEKDLKNLQKELMKLQKEQESLSERKSKVEIDLNSYEEEKMKIQETTDKLLEQAQTREQVENVLDMEKIQIDQLNEKHKETQKELEDINKETEENNKAIDKTKIKIDGINSSLEKTKKVEDISKTFNGVSKEAGKIIKKVSMWGLAIIGVRGAYSLIHSAMAQITSENEQMATNINYIKWAIAQTLKPLIEYIINLAIKAVGVVGALIKMLTGVNIFKNAGADKFAESMENANKNSKGVAGNLKDANKQLAGFDEMNVLSDTSSSGGGAGGGENITPDFDLSKLTDAEEKIEEFKNKWFEFGEEMETSLYDTPFEVWTEAFGNWDLAVYGVVEAFHGLWTLITGFFTFFKGIIDIIVGLIKGDTLLIQKGINEVIEGILQVIFGIIEEINGVMDIIWGIIKGVLLTIWDFIVGIVKAIWKWIDDNLIIPIANGFVSLWNGVVNGVKNAIKTVKDIFNSIVDFFAGIVSKILGFFHDIGVNVGNAISGAFKGVVNGVLGAIESILNTPIKAINKLINTINDIPGIKMGKLNTFNLPRLAKGGIVNQPGRGVMVGSAIAGERGQEGVLPLTDSQQMELLGEAIGRYITINANIVNSMNGRIISRELKKIQSEDDFAFNR